MIGKVMGLGKLQLEGSQDINLSPTQRKKIMNSNFKFKLLSHLTAKKEDKGFTLIELLVVVIIIGVLAAIALPNLLGQVGKARESEAKSTIGALNRAQQSYYTEKAAFANSTSLLEVPTGGGQYYTIAVPAAGTQLADGNDNPKNGTRDYIGGVSYNSDTRTFTSVVCRATSSPNFGLASADINTAGSIGAGATTSCSTAVSEQVK